MRREKDFIYRKMVCIKKRVRHMGPYDLRQQMDACMWKPLHSRYTVLQTTAQQGMITTLSS